MSIPSLMRYADGPIAVSADNLNTLMQTCQTADQLREFSGIDGMTVYLQGIETPNDGQGGSFAWNSAATVADDNSNIIVPVGDFVGAWLRVPQPGPGTGGVTVLGVQSFNGRGGSVVLSSADVTSALSYTPYNSTNPAGFITAAAAPVQTVSSRTGNIVLTHTDITDWAAATAGFGGGSTGVSSFNTRTGAVVLSSADVTSALTFTPYSNTNPANYINTSQAAAAAPVQTVATRTGNVVLTHTDITDWASATAGFGAGSTGVSSFNGRTGSVVLSSGDVTSALTFSPYDSANPSGFQTASQVTATLASPPAIGGTAAAGGSFTTLAASSTVSGAGFTARFASPGPIGSTAASTGAFTSVSASGVITSTVATGTAPFTVASTTNVVNLNASSLNGATFAAPGPIGSTTASTGTFTALSATSLSASGLFTNTFNSQAIPPSVAGGAISWNYSGGQGEVDFWNTFGTATGAYKWYWRTSAGAANLIASMNVSGTFTAVGGYFGTQTNDNAVAGAIGEYVSSYVNTGAPVSLTNNVAANITSISLTSGDWDCWATIGFNASASLTQVQGSISLTSNGMATGNGSMFSLILPFTTGYGPVCPTGHLRVSVATTTTVYMVALAGFASGTANAYGWLNARRRR